MASFELDVNGNLVSQTEKKKKKKSTVAFELDPNGKIIEREQELDRELAPSKEDGGKLDFFKKSARFEDGYQFGDISQTFSDTMADLSISALSGLAQMGEGITDLAGHLLAKGADIIGADRLASGLHNIANHDTVQTAADWLRDPQGDKGIGVGEGSILGRTSRGVGQAIGQIGGIILTGGAGSAAGLGAAGVTALTTGTMFASSAGSGMSEAYNAGASDAEALVYGSIKGGVDAATELIFGGLGKGVKALGFSHGLSSLDDVFAKKLSAKLSSRLAQTMVQTGVKASAEGFEEVLAGLGTAAAKKLTYMSDTELKQLVEDENLLEQFVVGTISSGIAQGGDFYKSVKNDTDFVSGLNKSEETVVQKEYEKRLAEEEKSGKALTKKEQNALYEQVVEDMDRGDISIDTIEEALGGEDYTKYQDAYKSEEVAKQEYDRLANTPKGELTHIQEKRLAELEKQLESEPASNGLKSKLAENVYNLSQGSRFMSSYTEKANRSVKFEADLEQYDEKQRAVVQKAVDSGILNNTRKTHDFVDLVAKLSAKTGVSFDFANNAKLKDSGLALEGRTVNGYVTKDGITLNIDSKKALNTVVGHEITHILEGTELHSKLQKAIFKYAQTKGEYDSRLKEMTELYKGVKDADINGELTAELVGDYLFTDSKFVNSLTEDRTLFKKIYDEVKYLVSIATAGSKEARELKRVEKLFANAIRSGGKQSEGVKYSLDEYTEHQKENWKSSKRIVVYESNEQLEQFIQDAISDNRSDKKMYFGAIPADLAAKIQADTGLNVEKYNLSLGAYEIRKILKDHGDGVKEALRGQRAIQADDFAHIVDVVLNPTSIELSDQTYMGKPAIIFKGNYNGRMNVVAVVSDKRLDLFVQTIYANTKKENLATPTGEQAPINTPEANSGIVFSKDNVAQKEENVKFSLSAETDTAYLDAVKRGDTETAQKMVDEAAKAAGYTVKAYHGTNAKFTVFKRGIKNGWIGKGIYFTDNKNYAKENGKRVISAYINPKNIYQSDAKDHFAIFSELNEKYPQIDMFNIAEVLKAEGYNGISYTDWDKGKIINIFDPEQIKSADPVTYDDNGNVIPLSERFNPKQSDIRYSLSPENAMQQQGGRGNVYGRDVALDIAPVREDAQANTKSNVENRVGDELTGAPIKQTAKVTREQLFPDDPALTVDNDDERLWSLTDEDAPAEIAPSTDSLPSAASDPLADKTWAEVGSRKVKAFMFENSEVKPYFQQEAEYLMQELRSTVKGERIYYQTEDGGYGWTGTSRMTSPTIATLRDDAKLSYKDIEKGINAILEDNGAENIAAAKRIELVLSERMANGYTDFETGEHIPPNQDYINALDQINQREAGNEHFDSLMEIADDIAPPVDSRQDLRAEIPAENPPAETPAERKPIKTVKERLESKLNNLQTQLAGLERLRQQSWDDFETHLDEVALQYEGKKKKNTKAANELLMRMNRIQPRMLNVDDAYNKQINDVKEKIAKVQEEIKSGESPKEQAVMRREVHENIIDDIKTAYREQGYDFDDVLKNAKDLSTFATVDNTPQRVLEKALGYKQGKILADLTVNKVADNETEGIKWLNSFTDRKNGLLAQISRQYNIKPGSKESAAAQMYAEGFYVNDKNEIVEYKDRELEKDFPDAKVRENIKGLAKDKRIREIYDATLEAINASRVRNAYPEIKKLENYFLHFRAMDDTFSRLGIPFNPNDIKAKDLPTDLNGVTADLKPGQPYFASSMHRKGKRTSFDLLGGLEQYLTAAKNQIYHIDDIQTLRALRNFVADTYGQAKGLDNLDTLTEEEQEAKIKEVYDGHLSTFAKFLNEEANVIAGKTSLADRGIEGIIGRKGITFMDTLNRQVGANMVGFNVSSALTNFVSAAQGFAKSNKADFVKAMAQTASNKLNTIKGKGDGFAESSPVMIRRKGADRFARTPWQKVADKGYVLMQAVDDISTEILARTKYNEYTRKGLTSEQAHIEADRWVSRLLGDRSLGQQPQLYNSKVLGMFTKFQLEVRNQLDSQFYDTIREAKVSNEDIEDVKKRNAKTAAQVASTFFQLAVVQHLFGKAFESVAGYNPTFDIISVLIKTFGLDDDEDDDDTVGDNLWQGFQELLGDLPYTSTFTGGRIPIASALPVAQFITGKDQYGNEKSRWETLKEAAPYYALPGGYGQIKKTTQGLSMFDDDLPIAGSYTDSGNLRFPVAPTAGNIAQAALFGQYASKNAREYFDNEYAPLKEKQIQELIDSDLPIAEYREYREGLKGKDTLGEKVAYIASLDLPISTKNMLVNNIADRKEPIDISNFGEYDDWGEFEYAHKYPEKYAFLQANNISVEQYESFDDDTKDAWSWAYQNPEKFAVAKAAASDVVTYREYAKALNDITADKDSEGKSISGSRKNKVVEYINSLELDYGAKIILFKTEYTADDTYNREIVDYLNSREDLSYEDVATILRELEFEVLDNGTVRW